MSNIDSVVEGSVAEGKRSGIDRRLLLKGTLGAAAAGLGAAALSACGAASASGRDPITLWHLFSGADGAKLSTMLADVQKQNPALDVHATCLAWGSPYYTKLAMSSAGGRPPDAAVMHVSRLSGYAPGGLLVPYDQQELAKRGISQDTVPAALWRRCLYENKLYSLPLDTHPFVAFYNLDLVQKARLATTSDGAPEITSQEQLLEVGRKLAEASGHGGISFGYLLDTAQCWRLFWGLYGQTGGKFSFESNQKAQWDEDKAAQVIGFIAKMLGDKANPGNLDYPGAISTFTSGATGMLLCGEWEMPGLKAGVKKLGASPMPTMFGQPASYADSHSFVLPKRLGTDSKRLALTYDLVTGLAKDGLVWAQGGHIPAYLPTVKEAAYQRLSPQAEYAPAAEHVFLDPPNWFTGAGSDFQNQMCTHLQQAFLGQTSPQRAQAAMLASISTFLSIPNPA